MNERRKELVIYEISSQANFEEFRGRHLPLAVLVPNPTKVRCKAHTIWGRSYISDLLCSPTERIVVDTYWTNLDPKSDHAAYIWQTKWGVLNLTSIAPIRFLYRSQWVSPTVWSPDQSCNSAQLAQRFEILLFFMNKPIESHFPAKSVLDQLMVYFRPPSSHLL